METVWYTATSMDGRIASADHDLAFLGTIAGPNDFEEFLATCDAAIVGASTLRWLLAGGHGWPHDDLPTWLVSHDEALAESVGPTRAPFRRVAGDLGPMVDEMEAAGVRRAWVAGGGTVAAQLLALDRLTEVVATVAPTVLGAGPALFDGDRLPLRAFELVEARPLGTAARLRWIRR